MKNTYFHAPTPYIPNFHWYIPLYLGCNSLDNIFAAAFQPFFIVRLCCIHFRYLRSNGNIWGKKT